MSTKAKLSKIELDVARATELTEFLRFLSAFPDPEEMLMKEEAVSACLERQNEILNDVLNQIDMLGRESRESMEGGEQ